MTDYTDLIERLRAPVPTVYDCKDAADALEAQARRIAELRKEADMMHSEYRTARARIAELEAALREAYEVYAGSDGFIPETAAEGYQQQLIKQIVDIIGAALEKKE